MLVLTRRIGETIVIDGVISVTVMAIRGQRTPRDQRAPVRSRGPLGSSWATPGVTPGSPTALGSL
jgi:hypothetical protein